ncbi:hypothetical protein M407DRAFT_177281 [Tulasnella calospora MUT 4182]|uniref:Cyclin-domain-containing protein n=1 Tax=Tulasnella calospora MUT 4182 TaxID=1051891 RepID=A0A0C3K6N6_9AGAM|nr:hypothetical protein M407DRAFT_177281 [Tulasnella calospora MUT 4182]
MLALAPHPPPMTPGSTTIGHHHQPPPTARPSSSSQPPSRASTSTRTLGSPKRVVRPAPPLVHSISAAPAVASSSSAPFVVPPPASAPLPPAQASPLIADNSVPPATDLASYPPNDLLRLLAQLLQKLASTNDKIYHSSSSGPNSNGTAPPQAHLRNFPHGGAPDGLQSSSSKRPLFNSLTSASRSSVASPTSPLFFHARNVPTISIESYLLRILKYCPTTNEVFLSLLVYFDRMGKLGEAIQEEEAVASKAKRDDDDDDEPMGEVEKPEASSSTAAPLVIDSYNIHRLIIAGVTVASKFFSDVFYTNSRYAKVGGLPTQELNKLELQFLLLNDFRLAIPPEELQHYFEHLLSHSYSETQATRSQPTSPGIELFGHVPSYYQLLPVSLPIPPSPAPSTTSLSSSLSSHPPAQSQGQYDSSVPSSVVQTPATSSDLSSESASTITQSSFNVPSTVSSTPGKHRASSADDGTFVAASENSFTPSEAGTEVGGESTDDEPTIRVNTVQRPSILPSNNEGEDDDEEEEGRRTPNRRHLHRESLTSNSTSQYSSYANTELEEDEEDIVASAAAHRTRSDSPCASLRYVDGRFDRNSGMDGTPGLGAGTNRCGADADEEGDLTEDEVVYPGSGRINGAVPVRGRSSGSTKTAS